MSRVIRNSFVIGLVALLACDRPGMSSTPFTGTLAGNTVAVAGRGAYDCPSVFGPYRADVDAHVTGTTR